MQCALQAGAPLRQRGLEARVAIAAHNGWQPVVRREHRLQRRAGQPVRDRLAVFAIEVQQLRIDAKACATHEKAHDEVEVLGDPQRWVVAVRVVRDEAVPDQRLQVTQRLCAAEQGIGVNVVCRGDPECGCSGIAAQACCNRDRGILVKDQQVIGNDVGAVPLGRRDQALQPIGMHQVVAVHHGDPSTSRGVEAQVARHTGAAVGRSTKQPHSSVGVGNRGYQVCAAVGGCVVGNNHFNVAQALRQGGLQSSFDVSAAVVVGHGNRDEWWCVPIGSLCWFGVIMSAGWHPDHGLIRMCFRGAGSHLPRLETSNWPRVGENVSRRAEAACDCGWWVIQDSRPSCVKAPVS